MTNRWERVLTAIFLYPLTWLAFCIVICAEWSFIVWFEPPMLTNFGIIGIGLVLLALWVAMFIRSEEFRRRYNRMPDETDSNDLEKLISQCHPEFARAVRESLTMIEKIRKEFEKQAFQVEVEGLLINLTDLTRNHLQLYSRSRQFGTEEQQQAMQKLISQQIGSVEESLTALKRFSGNLTLFDSQISTQKDIDEELTLINQGLQEAIREVMQ